MRIANEQLSFWSNHIEHCQWRKRRRRQRRRKWAGCAWTMSLNENCASLMQIINMKHCDHHHHHHNKSKISSAIATANARTSTMAPEICLVVHEKTTLSSSIEIHNDRYGCLYSTRFTSWWKKDLINLTRSRRPLSVSLSASLPALMVETWPNAEKRMHLSHHFNLLWSNEGLIRRKLFCILMLLFPSSGALSLSYARECIDRERERDSALLFIDLLNSIDREGERARKCWVSHSNRIIPLLYQQEKERWQLSRNVQGWKNNRFACRFDQSNDHWKTTQTWSKSLRLTDRWGLFVYFCRH